MGSPSVVFSFNIILKCFTGKFILHTTNIWNICLLFCWRTVRLFTQILLNSNFHFQSNFDTLFDIENIYTALVKTVKTSCFLFYFIYLFIYLFTACITLGKINIGIWNLDEVFFYKIIKRILYYFGYGNHLSMCNI